MSLHPQDQDGSLVQHQIQAPLLDLPGEAGGPEEEGDQRGTGSGEGIGDHRQVVEWWQNLGEQRDLFVVEVFWVWVFS